MIKSYLDPTFALGKQDLDKVITFLNYISSDSTKGWERVQAKFFSNHCYARHLTLKNCNSETTKGSGVKVYMF